MIDKLFRLEGRCALVTGASRGLGRAMARALAAAGAHIVLASRDADALERVATDIHAGGGKASTLALDVRDRAAIHAAAQLLATEFDGPDILLHCAGIIDRSPFDDATIEAWDEVIATNLTSSFVLAKEMTRVMARKGWGRIINVGSVLSIASKPGAVAYTASKHGLAGLTKSLAVELGPRGVLANAICPGYLRTDINTALQQDPDHLRMIETRTPLRRWGNAEELNGVAVFLASDASSFVTGHLLLVDGGLAANS
jgi:gluconate 5-dehydrogenase